MKKVKLKHRESTYISDLEGDPRMSRLTLEQWIKDGIEEGLGAFNIEESLNQIFNLGKIKEAIIESLAPEIINAVTPYYKDEFSSCISRGKLMIRPWFDDYWQEIKIVDLVEESVQGWETENLKEIRDAFVESLKIINKEIEELKGE